ncbi:MAG: sulfate adenylyltransferase [Candidatus Kerfeldbacteria bacterium]
MIAPHGNKLVERVLPEDKIEEVKKEAASLVSITLNEEQIKDVKNIARGVLSPLTGFMNRADFEGVVDNMKLASGITWSIPFVLHISEEEAAKMKSGDRIALVGGDGELVALMTIGDIYDFDVEHVAEKVFGTADNEHPGVARWRKISGRKLVGGDIDLVDNSKEPFYDYNLDPAETRYLFKQYGWNTVAGFQTRNTPHRAHEYLQRCALELVDGLFINPIIGEKKAGDFQDDLIIKTYDYLIKNFFPKERATFSILPARMNYAGPREAILHAIIRKNFGCTHFVVGRDHAGVGNYYGSYDAQEIFDQIEDIGIEIMKFEHSFLCKKCDTMATTKTCGHTDADRVCPSGSLIRELLSAGKPVPEDIMRKEIVDLLLAEKNLFVTED